MVAVTYRPGAHARRRRCPASASERQYDAWHSPAATRVTYFALSSSEPWSSTGGHRQLRDEREQRRRRADPRDLLHCDRVGEDAAALAAVRLRETQAPRSRASRHASQLAHGYSSRSSAAAAFGAMCSSASRRTDSRSSTYSSGRTNASRAPRQVRATGRAAPGEPATRRPVRPARYPACAAAPRGPRRPAPAGGCSRARHRARAVRAARRTRRRRPVVAEQLHRNVDVADNRRAPEERRALARDLGEHRDRRLRRARAATGADGALDPRRERVRVADVRTRAAQSTRRLRTGAPAPRSPGRSARQSRAGGSANPGGRFCCWRGRSPSSGRHERVSGHRRDGTRCRRRLRSACGSDVSSRSGANRTGSSRAGPATTPR